MLIWCPSRLIKMYGLSVPLTNHSVYMTEKLSYLSDVLLIEELVLYCFTNQRSFPSIQGVAGGVEVLPSGL